MACARVKYYCRDKERKWYTNTGGTRFVQVAVGREEAQGINKILVKPTKFPYHYDRICAQRKVGKGTSESNHSYRIVL